MDEILAPVAKPASLPTTPKAMSFRAKSRNPVEYSLPSGFCDWHAEGQGLTRRRTMPFLEGSPCNAISI